MMPGMRFGLSAIESVMLGAADNTSMKPARRRIVSEIGSYQQLQQNRFQRNQNILYPRVVLNSTAIREGTRCLHFG